YVDRFTLPHIRRMARAGARARALVPVFPSLTFPNHYSLATGLTPERHGIVSNSFYDPGLRARYSLSDRAAVADARWYRGEPIWVTAETQGMVAACFFWPGSEAPINGVRPTLWRPYDGGIPNDERVDTVLEWLRLPSERRPHLVTLYFSQLDSVSHEHPLNAPAIERAAQSLDRTIGRLMAGIAGLPDGDRVYILLTSDHGMAEVTPSQELSLDAMVDMSSIEAAFGGPVASLHVRGGAGNAVAIRDRLNARLKNGRAYLRRELPPRFRYRGDPRAGDIVVVMDESWPLITGLRRIARPFLGRRGMHGWDPALPSMHALFIASGPDIRAGAVIPQVEMVDLYPFMTELLGLRPARDVDGRAGHLRQQIVDTVR
ncbi:MAG TPA: ectonucleotide pyrophosphatase/phosphodiesterase, partial [Vicinamibacterales bacterium]|nr:ectonucleotide pyrophosphatase/phosphodiesterase [Vicinamibacterales bacterium]